MSPYEEGVVAGIEQGRNQVLYRLLAMEHENAAHDHWHPEIASVLQMARREIAKQFRIGVGSASYLRWPTDRDAAWPDFEKG